MINPATAKDNNILVLDNPILIDGKEVAELSYNATEITVALYMEACAKAAAASFSGGGQANAMRVKEVDYNLHVYLGMASVIAVNSNIAFDDLERVKGFDILTLANIGNFFIYRKSAEPSGRSDSENSDEATPGTSTRVSGTLTSDA